MATSSKAYVGIDVSKDTLDILVLGEKQAWQKQEEILGSAPGVGKLDRKKIAALVGVAPMNYDSGKKRGYRKTKGGRADVRSVRALHVYARGYSV